ncbi:MAG: winged helix-turn-helix domain-containing protein [Alistipes indistinctus]
MRGSRLCCDDRAQRQLLLRHCFACGDLELNYASRRARRGTEEVDLTEKEFRLLEFLMQNQGAALSRQVLLKNVWERILKPIRMSWMFTWNYLRGKVDRDPARRLIHTVVGIGYMMQAK